MSSNNRPLWNTASNGAFSDLVLCTSQQFIGTYSRVLHRQLFKKIQCQSYQTSLSKISPKLILKKSQKPILKQKEDISKLWSCILFSRCGEYLLIGIFWAVPNAAPSAVGQFRSSWEVNFSLLLGTTKITFLSKIQISKVNFETWRGRLYRSFSMEKRALENQEILQFRSQKSGNSYVVTSYTECLIMYTVQTFTRL